MAAQEVAAPEVAALAAVAAAAGGSGPGALHGAAPMAESDQLAGLQQLLQGEISVMAFCFEVVASCEPNTRKVPVIL